MGSVAVDHHRNFRYSEFAEGTTLIVEDIQGAPTGSAKIGPAESHENFLLPVPVQVIFEEDEFSAVAVDEIFLQVRFEKTL